MHLLFLIEEEEDKDLLLRLPNAFIVKNMTTSLNSAGKKLMMRRRKKVIEDVEEVIHDKV